MLKEYFRREASNFLRLGKSLAIVVLIVYFDQATKQYFNNILVQGESIQIFQGLDFTLVYNSGAAFGILAEHSGWQRWFLISVSVIATVGIIVFLYLNRESEFRYLLPLVLILSGAFGNLIDRVNLGYVIDFVHFYYKNWSWPAFNIADSAIFIGAGLLFLHIVKQKNSDSG